MDSKSECAHAHFIIYFCIISLIYAIFRIFLNGAKCFSLEQKTEMLGNIILQWFFLNTSTSCQDIVLVLGLMRGRKWSLLRIREIENSGSIHFPAEFYERFLPNAQCSGGKDSRKSKAIYTLYQILYMGGPFGLLLSAILWFNNQRSWAENC